MKSKVLTAFLSVLIAFGLWAYVVTVEVPEDERTYYHVPVVLDGQNLLAERNLMLVSGQDYKVNLTLSGYRTDLNKLDNTNITLLANMGQITEPGEHWLNYTVSYPGNSGAINVVQKDPQQIKIEVVELSKKEIPVKVAYSGQLPSGYTVDRQNVVLDHTIVTVSGPKDVVDQIAQARITVDLTGKVQTIDQTFRHALCDDTGKPIEDVSSITVNVSDIRANITIRKLKEVPLHIEIIPGGGLTANMVTITPDRTSITVAGSEADLADLDQIVLGAIDLGKLTGNASQIFEIDLPDGVTNVTGVTAVTVQIQIPPMSVKRFTVTTFEAVNVPNGARVEFQTKQLEVDIRGPAALLNKLSAEDIVAVVDFSDAGPGSASYVAVIEVRGVEGVGAIGRNYSVSAEVIPRIPLEE